MLTSSFAVHGSDSERASTILARDFGERPDGTFTVVFRVHHSSDRALRTRLHRRLVRAARAVPTGSATPLRRGGGVLYGDVTTTLDLQNAKGYTDDLRRALRSPGGPPAYVSGQPAIQHDLDPILSSDLRRGEAIAIPIALLVLLVVFGLSVAIAIPFLFAACTIAATLGVVYAFAHVIPIVTYVPNLVELIGLGLAVDYSLLVVYRFREELARGRAVEEAVVATMATAGRAVVFSGVAVAIGLGLLLLMPVPFIRSLGLGGFLIPLASIAAALTLQPALLSLLAGAWHPAYRGRRPVRRVGLPLPVLPGTANADDGIWARLARSIMRRPLGYLGAGIGPAAGGGRTGVLSPADARLDLRAAPLAGVGARLHASARPGGARRRHPDRRSSSTPARPGGPRAARAGRGEPARATSCSAIRRSCSSRAGRSRPTSTRPAATHA